MVHEVTVYDRSGVKAVVAGPGLEVSVTGPGVLLIRRDGHIIERISAGDWTWSADTWAVNNESLPAPA